MESMAVFKANDEDRIDFMPPTGFLSSMNLHHRCLRHAEN
jgi:hypothetical protein